MERDLSRADMEKINDIIEAEGKELAKYINCKDC